METRTSRTRNLRVIHWLVRWVHLLAPDRYLPIAVRRGALHGRHLMLNLRYQMGYWLGLTEPDVQAAMKALIGPGDVVYDVGAEIGYFSVLAAVMSRWGSVYAFEPNPANLAVLHQTAILNSDLHLTIIPKAVGSTRGRVKFLTYSHRDDVANASLLGRLAELATGEANCDCTTVDMTDLDSFSAETGVMPDVIKIDVEGAEGLVLQGMTLLLTKKRPRLIIEIHNETTQHEMTTRLAAHGYNTRPIGRTFETAYPFRVLSLPAPLQDLPVEP